MSTNQERRAEARQRLREQMEAQARREKQLKIAAAAVVVVVLAGIIGVVVWNKAEEARVAIRNSRRHAIDAVKKLEKNKEIGEDDAKRAEKDLDAATKKFIDQIDELLKAKEAELMEV